MTNARYLRALAAWLALYLGLLATSLVALSHFSSGPWLVPVTLLPVPALFGMLHAIMRRYRGMDELERRVMSDAIVFAYGVTAITTFSYGFLENSAHAPTLSYFWVWPIMATAWGLGMGIASRRYR